MQEPRDSHTILQMLQHLEKMRLSGCVCGFFVSYFGWAFFVSSFNFYTFTTADVVVFLKGATPVIMCRGLSAHTSVARDTVSVVEPGSTDVYEHESLQH